MPTVTNCAFQLLKKRNMVPCAFVTVTGIEKITKPSRFVKRCDGFVNVILLLQAR